MEDFKIIRDAGDYGVPCVIVHCGMSIDGRVTPARGHSVPKDAWDVKLYLGFQRRLRCDAVMVGSSTVLELKVPRPVDSLDEEFRGDTERLIVIPDSRGRVRWSGWQEDPWLKGLVVLCSQATPASYIEHLREEEVQYVVAGADNVDLLAALKEIRKRYGVERIVCQGGGAINGALLRAGLVREISVLVVPFAVGGFDTPTLFDAPNLASSEGMTRLQLINCECIKEDFIWLHYMVVE